MSNNFDFKRSPSNLHAAPLGTALERKNMQNSRNNQINLYFRPLICNFAGSMKQVRPKKNLGQHFLTDLSIAKRFAVTAFRDGA